MRHKLLVVDDDPEMRRALVQSLGEAYEVLEAPTGRDALLILASQRPRLMLLDMTMPGMSGLEVLAAAPDIVKAMTVLMLTGENDVELAKRALDLGADEFITKPFDWPRLKDKVERSMNVTPGGSGRPWRVKDDVKAS
ncbi:MAG: response regulator [Elusimicrobiota bacterium]|nr:response regulator [Elusimicrobiota bacterium]